MVLTLTVVLVYLGWMDYALTSVILMLGGVELNPLLVPIVGTPYFLPLKLGAPLAFGLLLYLTHPTHQLSLEVRIKNPRIQVIFHLILFVVIVYMAVTTWAVFDLYRALK